MLLMQFTPCSLFSCEPWNPPPPLPHACPHLVGLCRWYSVREGCMKPVVIVHWECNADVGWGIALTSWACEQGRAVRGRT